MSFSYCTFFVLGFGGIWGVGIEVNVILSVWQRLWNILFLQAISDEWEQFPVFFL